MTKQENNFEKLTVLEIYVFKKILQNIDLKYWVDVCYDFKSKFPSNARSNVGGYQSPGNLNTYPEFFDLVDILNSNIRSITNPNNRIISMWLNVSSYKNYNALHHHDDKTHPYTSGVIYLKTPSNCGDIQFYNPVNLNHSSDITPSEGQLLLFPSFVYHGVCPNFNTTEDRISIAFNCDL